MAEKLSPQERLRRGMYVEVEPGKFWSLDKERREFVTETGERIPVPRMIHDDLFGTPEQIQEAQEVERLRGQFSYPGAPTVAGFGAGSALISGGLDIAQDLANTGKDYAMKRRAKERFEGEMAEKHPYQTFLGKGLGIGADVVATGGLSPVAAGAGLAMAAQGSKIYKEPVETLFQGLIGGGTGYVADKGANYLGKIAARRGLGRQIAAEGEEAKQVFAKSMADYERDVKIAGDKYRASRAANSEKAVQDKIAYDLAVQARNDAIRQGRLEAKKGAESYKKEVADLPKKKLEAYKKAAEVVAKDVEKLESELPSTIRISRSDLDIDDIVTSSLRQGERAGTAEARTAEKIIGDLFPEGQSFGAKDFSRRMASLERTIGAQSPEIREALEGARTAIYEKLPYYIADHVASSEFLEKLPLEIEKTLRKSLPKVISKEDVAASVPFIAKKYKDYIKNISKKDFIARLERGDLLKELEDVFPENFLFGDSGSVKIRGRKPIAIDPWQAPWQSIQQDAKHEFIDNLAKEIDLYDTLLDSARERALKAYDKLSERFVLQEPFIAEPVPPAPFEPPPTVPKPAPIPPVPPPVIPPPPVLNMPQMPPPASAAERVGDFLERPMSDVLPGGKWGKIASLGYAMSNPIGALKKGVGGMATVGTAKALTSPTAMGDVLRQGLRQGGVAAADALARKYPSYNDGILDDPVERRSLAAEVERLPIEPQEKAVIQSKINRGLRLDEKIY